MKSVYFSIFAALVIVASSAARADDCASLWAARADAQKTAQAADCYGQAAANASDDDAKYDALIMQSKALYWQGVQVAGSEENNDAKVPVFEKAYTVADQAIQLNGDYAEGYYMYAINMGVWGLAKGKTNALFKLKDLENHVDEALKHDTKAGKSGESYDSFGPDRTYGRMYNQLPFPMKDNAKSLSYLEKAYKGAPDCASNVLYYAETLHDMGQTDKATSVLQQMLKSSPQDFGAKLKRVPETIREFALARQDLADWN